VLQKVRETIFRRDLVAGAHRHTEAQRHPTRRIRILEQLVSHSVLERAERNSGVGLQIAARTRPCDRISCVRGSCALQYGKSEKQNEIQAEAEVPPCEPF
jgi:hypothetical protein